MLKIRTINADKESLFLIVKATILSGSSELFVFQKNHQHSNI